MLQEKVFVYVLHDKNLFQARRMTKFKLTSATDMNIDDSFVWHSKSLDTTLEAEKEYGLKKSRLNKKLKIYFINDICRWIQIIITYIYVYLVVPLKVYDSVAWVISVSYVIIAWSFCSNDYLHICTISQISLSRTQFDF